MKRIVIKKLTLEKIYSELKNQKKVAEYFNVSLKVIKRLVKEYGLSTYNNISKISKPSIEELYESAKNFTKEEIAKKYNVCISTVSKWLKEYKITLTKSDFKKLTQMQRDVVIGSILGDGSIDGRILGMCHSIKQEEYLDYKRSFFQNEIGEKYYRKYRGYKSVRCRTKAFGEIKILESVFYTEKHKKIIPVNIKDFLSPLSIAIWYLDDGSRKGKNYGNIATCCFTYEENLLLSNAINEIIGIESKVVIDNQKYPMLILPAKNDTFLKFCRYIEKYVPDCMRYKLSKEV